MVFLCACAGSENDSGLHPMEKDILYDTAEEDISQNSEEPNERAEDFLRDFPQNYPDFELLDYVAGFDENTPIVLAAIAANKETGSSSTLFIVDEYGIGQVVLASDSPAYYREEDGLTLEDNVISVALNLTNPNQTYEIHDFAITVSQEEKQGTTNTIYASKETLRTD